jgi:hypothetical protein
MQRSRLTYVITRREQYAAFDKPMPQCAVIAMKFVIDFWEMKMKACNGSRQRAI